MSALQYVIYFAAIPLMFYGLVALCSDVLILLRDLHTPDPTDEQWLGDYDPRRVP